MKQANRCVKASDLAKETGENEAKVLNCLSNLDIRDMVCRDGNLWCPDNL